MAQRPNQLHLLFTQWLRPLLGHGGWLWLCFVLFFSSCGYKRFIPENKRLVHKVTFKGAPKEQKGQLYNLVEPQPNRRIMGLTRFHLRRYAFTKRMNRLFGWEVQGEPPTVYDETAMNRSVERMQMYLKNEGYFNAKVRFETRNRGKRKIVVKVKVEAGKPYTIAKPIAWDVRDSQVYEVLQKPNALRFISPGAVFSSEAFTNERANITNLLKRQGYYQFSQENIFFDVDSSYGQHQTKITVRITSPKGQEHHEKWYLQKVVVNPNFQFQDSTRADTQRMAKGFYILGDPEDAVNQIIYSYIYIKPGDVFNNERVQQSLRKLRELQEFKYINVRYEVDTVGRDSNWLNMYLEMTPYSRYSLQFQTELNTSEEQYIRAFPTNRLYGLAMSTSFNDINFLKRGIRSELAITGAIDLGIISNNLGLYNGEFGLSNSYYFPRPFLHELIPASLEENIRSSSLRGQFFREINPDYLRTTGTVNLGYMLKKGIVTHVVSPVEFSLVGATLVSDTFKKAIDATDNLFLRNLFNNHVLAGSRWMMYYNNKAKSRGNHYWDLQFTVAELAGNSFFGLSQIIGREAQGDAAETFKNTLLSMNYFQYFRGDYDVRFHQNTFFGHEIVYRAYAGFMIPFGNTPNAIPFERRYYAGGSNGIRGWAIRELGPGGFNTVGQEDLIFLKSGDIKIELNAEYRFGLTETFKMAFFVDAGNVWNHPQNRIDVPNGDFAWNNFYRELAIAGGLGTRLDFTYFIFRLDLGFPLKDPSLPEGERWFADMHYAPFKFFQTPQLNFGIGYPF